MTAPPSDYSQYDYKTEFWVKQNRQYEHLCETTIVQKSLQKVPTPVATFLDAGCGFGRLFPAYSPFSTEQVLVDYAKNLLEQAEEAIPKKTAKYIQSDITKMPLESTSVDMAMSIRVLHHIKAPEDLFSEIHRVLKPSGYFLIDVPNKRHILNLIRGTLTLNLSTYTSSGPIELAEHFYNFHPKIIIQALQKTGFTILHHYNTSYFRSPTLKRIFPASFLHTLDQTLQGFLPPHFLTPSIYLLCKKD